MTRDHAPTKFTTTLGLEGHWGKTTVTGITKKRKCDHNGYAMAFVFKNAKGDLTAWVLYSATNVNGEIPEATAKTAVADAELVEPGGNRTELLEAGEGSFGHVAVPVDGLVEASGRPPRCPRPLRLAV